MIVIQTLLSNIFKTLDEMDEMERVVVKVKTIPLNPKKIK